MQLYAYSRHGRGRVTLAPTASCNPRVTTKLNVYVGLTIVYVGSRAREMLYNRRNLIACTYVKPIAGSSAKLVAHSEASQIASQSCMTCVHQKHIAATCAWVIVQIRRKYQI
jgi:hypothetical protein